ncbi:MAG: hypothetical protein ACOC58_00060 [Chloroflexota bacterium]
MTLARQGHRIIDGHPTEPTWYANTVRVAQYGADFNRIQAAINYAASQGPTADNRWTVLVSPGTYAEQVTMAQYVDLVGVDGGAVVIQATGGQTAVTMAEGSRVANLTLDITADAGGSVIGVQCNDASCTIEDIRVNGTRLANDVYTVQESVGATARTIRIRNLWVTGSAVNTYGLRVTQANKTVYIEESYMVCQICLYIAGASTVYSKLNFYSASGGYVGSLLAAGAIHMKEDAIDGVFQQTAGTITYRGRGDDLHVFPGMSIADALSAGSMVYVHDGTYNTTATLTVGDHQTLQMDSDAVLVPQGNFDVITIEAGATVRGGNIDTSGLTTTFTSACIHIDGSTFHEWHEDRLTFVRDVYMLGYKDATQGYGIGVFYQAEGDDRRIFRVFTQGLHIQNFERAYYLHTTGTGWINANHNRDGIVAYCDYAFHLDRDGDAILGNTFRDIDVQAGPTSKKGVQVDGACSNNSFDVWLSDWAGYAGDKTAVYEEMGAAGNVYDLICDERNIATVGNTPLFDVISHYYGSVVDTSSRKTMRGQRMKDLHVPEGCAFYLPVANNSGAAVSSFEAPYGLVDLYNAPTWGTTSFGRGKLTFDGTTQYGKTRLSNMQGVNLFSRNQSFIIVVKPSFDYDDGAKHVFFHTSRTNFTGFEIAKRADNQLAFRSWKSGAFDVSAAATVEFSAGDPLVIIGSNKDDDTIYLFVNGILVATANPTEVQENNVGNFWFMSDQGPGNYAGGDLLYFAWLSGFSTDDHTITDAGVAERLTDRLAMTLGLEGIRFGMARMPDGPSGHVLTAQGAGADPILAPVDYPRKLKLDTVARWVLPGWYCGGGLTLTVTANRIYYTPIFVSEDTTFIRIGCNVTTAVAGTADLRIFEWDDGLPGAQILSAGTVDTSTTGYKEIVINQTLARGYYFLAIRCTAAPTLRGLDILASMQLPVSGRDSVSGSYLYHAILYDDGAYADPAPTPDGYERGDFAFVRLREN